MAAQIYFIADLKVHEEEKPFAIDQISPNAGFPITNIKYEKHNVLLHDIRHEPSKPEIDTHSFCYITHASQFTHLPTEEEMMWPYAKETTDLLKKKFQTDHAICFDLRVGLSAYCLSTRNPLTDLLSVAQKPGLY
jgi:hypothetical protein